MPSQILRKDVIKSLHDDIHGEVSATQSLRLQAWRLGYYKDVEEHIRRCPKCMEIKTFKQTKIHMWPKEGARWTRVYMDHAHIRDIGLFLVDSFSGFPEVKVRDRKATIVRKILRIIFARNGVPKTIVMDNTPEICNESLGSWLRKIGCMPCKTSPIPPSVKRHSRKDGPNSQNGFKGIFTFQPEYCGIPP